MPQSKRLSKRLARAVLYVIEHWHASKFERKRLTAYFKGPQTSADYDNLLCYPRIVAMINETYSVRATSNTTLDHWKPWHEK